MINPSRTRSLSISSFRRYASQRNDIIEIKARLTFLG